MLKIGQECGGCRETKSISIDNKLEAVGTSIQVKDEGCSIPVLVKKGEVVKTVNVLDW